MVKLICSIPPRADGTVSVLDRDGKKYAFTPTGDGETACEVPLELAKRLLQTPNFYPADDGAITAVTAGHDNSRQPRQPSGNPVTTATGDDKTGTSPGV